MSQPRLRLRRIYTQAGVHPYDQVEWGRRDVSLVDSRSGLVVFEQLGVEFPISWSQNAVNIVTTKYFRGTPGDTDREWSLKQLVDRVVNAYVKHAGYQGYFATADDELIFAMELKYCLIHQVFSFNSPVWLNVGTDAPQQVSACYIMSAADRFESILEWLRVEAMIFKGGSGCGINLSQIRSSREKLTSGVAASGPLAFMRCADSLAGAIKSGGIVRRPAKMVVLDVGHPDIELFIGCKAREEEKIRALQDAGFDMDLGGSDVTSVQYQNANNSVRITDLFMRAVEDDASFRLRSPVTGAILRELPARELFRQLATAAWECGDPGVQFDDTINRWHTCPASGPITASNPCGEYVHLDNSACNLATINLLSFLTGDQTFDTDRFIAVTELVFTAMDVSIGFADFPTDEIKRVTTAHRQLGIGYANLGALVMAMGYAYDSDAARSVAAAVTAVMTASAYRRSAEMAAAFGPYEEYGANLEAHRGVILSHAAAADALAPMGRTDREILAKAKHQWTQCINLGNAHGYRNAQATLLAPAGTCGLMMDCDTTGIEPDFALVKSKRLVGGETMRIVNQCVSRALKSLGYDEREAGEITAHVLETGSVAGAAGLRISDYDVFDCAVGERAIAPLGHVRMMAAVQPHLSGAISKSVNLPQGATVETIEELLVAAWRSGVKSITVYRDQSKASQPLTPVRGIRRGGRSAKGPRSRSTDDVVSRTWRPGTEILDGGPWNPSAPAAAVREVPARSGRAGGLRCASCRPNASTQFTNESISGHLSTLTTMRPAGSCHVCETCGQSTGCS